MMIVPPPQVRVFVRPGATDMRKAFDGLFGIAKEIMNQDPLSGHLFVFCNKRRDRRAAVIYTLIANCKVHGIDPFAYLRDLLRRLPAAKPGDYAALTPRAMKAAAVLA